MGANMAMREIEIIADYGDLCGEAPLWDARAQTLYWSDCVGLKVYRYQPKTGRHEVVKRGVEANALALHESGGFVITNSTGVWLWDGADGLRLIADSADGAKCRLNDAIIDPEGRLFAGSNFYDPAGEYEMAKLFRVDTDGTAHVVDEGFHLSNGLAFSPDSRILYSTDSVGRRIYAYDYHRVTGEIRNRRVLIEVPNDEGVPDGLTVDAQGFLWSAQWYGSSVVRYDPDGKVERRISVPAKQTSSVMFGGADLTDIFITSAARSEPMPVMPRGYDAVSGHFGGELYHLNLGIQGREEYRARIRPSS